MNGTNNTSLHPFYPIQFYRPQQLPVQRQTYMDIRGVFPYRVPVFCVVDPYGNIQPGPEERPIEGACLSGNVLGRNHYPSGLSNLEEMGA